MLVSNCCSAPLIHPDIEMCSDCKEHCEGMAPECLDCHDRISDELYKYDPEYPRCTRCGYLAFKC